MSLPGQPKRFFHHLYATCRRKEPAWREACLSLGSNLGDRLAFLQAGLDGLEAEPLIEVIRVSSVYETDPWGLTDQPAFYNAVVRVRTALLPLALLRACQRIERRSKRKREIHWGPRTLDIDILTLGCLRMDIPRLTLPHPRMQERDFVLVPLAEITSGDLLERPGVHRLASLRLKAAAASPTDGSVPGG